MPLDRGDIAQSWAAGTPFGEVEQPPSLPGYDDWAAAMFPAGTPPANTLSNADPDGDRIANSAEYAFATDPLVADASSAEPTVTIVEDRLQIDFRVRETSPLDYTISQSSNLLNWANLDVGDFDVLSTTPTEGGIGARRVVRLTATISSSAYYRITAHVTDGGN